MRTNKSVDMGAYYIGKLHGLVRTVCRATNHDSEDTFIVYVQVGENGCASEPLLMPEQAFKNTFLV